MMIQPNRKLRLSWFFSAVWVISCAVIGIGWWEEWRVTVAPPGLAVGMGFFSTIIALLLAIGLAIVWTITRNKATIIPLAVWFLADLAGTISLALYAIPEFPAWVFKSIIVTAGVILLFTNPSRRSTEPEKIIREVFRQLRPEQHIAWSKLSADESDRFVVGIFYGDTRPPRYSFYAVNKATGEVTQIDDDSAYRPKVWR